MKTSRINKYINQILDITSDFTGTISKQLKSTNTPASKKVHIKIDPAEQFRRDLVRFKRLSQPIKPSRALSKALATAWDFGDYKAKPIVVTPITKSPYAEKARLARALGNS